MKLDEAINYKGDIDNLKTIRCDAALEFDILICVLYERGYAWDDGSSLNDICRISYLFPSCLCIDAETKACRFSAPTNNNISFSDIELDDIYIQKRDKVMSLSQIVNAKAEGGVRKIALRIDSEEEFDRLSEMYKNKIRWASGDLLNRFRPLNLLPIVIYLSSNNRITYSDDPAYYENYVDSHIVYIPGVNISASSIMQISFDEAFFGVKGE